MTRMAAMPLYAKKTFKIFFSGTERQMNLKLGMQHQVLENYQVLFKWCPWVDIDLFYGKNLVPYAFVWEKVKTMEFSEIIIVYDIKVGRCSQLIEYMKLYEYQRSRLFNDLGPNHSDSIFLAHLSWRLTRWAYRMGLEPASVRASVHTFKHEYLRDQQADYNQILSEASLGWGKGCIRFWCRSDQNSGFHGNG